MKIICSHKDQCADETCSHAAPHDDCAYACGEVAGARCVVDVMSLPEIGDMGTVAIVIPRLRRET